MRNEKQKTIRSVRAGATLIGVLSMVLGAAAVSPAQDEQASPNVIQFKTLVNFDETNGESPLSGLVQGTDGNL